MEAHAALPELEDLQRMREVIERLVEQHVAQPAADDHADHPVEQHVVDVARMPARQQVLARPPLAQDDEQDEADEIHEPVPADRERSELNGHGIELRVNQHGGHASARRPALKLRAPIIRERLQSGPAREPPPGNRLRYRLPVQGASRMPNNRRSQIITQGVARSPNRSMLRAVGFKDGDFDKPIVGIANGHSTMNPCNAGLQQLARSRRSRGARRRRHAADVRRDHRHRRHQHGHRGDEIFAGVARGDRRLHRDRGDEPEHGRRAS